MKVEERQERANCVSGALRDRDMTRVVHRHASAYDVYIGRPSKWGNPFVIGVDGTRAQVIAKYRAWILRQPKLLSSLSELRGKTLGCYCAPLPCHGDVLAEMADKIQGGCR